MYRSATVLAVAAVIGLCTAAASPGEAVEMGPTADVASSSASVVTTRVKKLNADLCLAASGGVGTAPIQTTCGTGAEQYWEFVGPYDVEHGGYYYLMRNKATGLCLRSGGTTAPAPIEQVAECDSTRGDHKWGITSGDIQMLGDRGSDLHVTLPGSAPGTPAHMDEFLGNESDNQQAWTFLDEQPKW
jgi:hypothetical protein